MARPYFKQQIPLDEVERLAGLGLNWRQISGALSLSEDTLQRRRKDDPEVEEAFHRGRSSTISAVANSVVERALKGDMAACKLFLNSVGGWAKRIELDTKQPILNIIMPKALSSPTGRPEGMALAITMPQAEMVCGTCVNQ